MHNVVLVCLIAKINWKSYQTKIMLTTENVSNHNLNGYIIEHKLRFLRFLKIYSLVYKVISHVVHKTQV